MYASALYTCKHARWHVRVLAAGALVLELVLDFVGVAPRDHG